MSVKPRGEMEPVMMEPGLVDSDRVTVNLHVHYEQEGEAPVGVNLVASRYTETQEQPYVRKLKIGEEWTKLDLKWVEDNVGLIVIHNRAGQLRSTNPTPEEAEEDAKKIVWVGCGENIPSDDWKIRPGFPMVAEPDVSNVWVRSAFGEVPITVTATPR